MRPTWGLTPAPAWTHRYARLGPPFVTPWQATPLPQPHWVARSDALASELGWPADWAEQGGLLDVLAGNQPWPGSEPLTSVYSGHQFGVWAGQLGDGRALWLGEMETAMGPQEIQLKGAGPTPYSRMGDGRAVLRSSIREFLCSEAMHGLGIPTTRALAVVGSPAKVLRESIETAAVVTRVAPSFLRFGHFEHFAAIDQPECVRQLIHFCREHLGLGLAHAGPDALALLRDVLDRTALMLAHWQAVGFCHGVMNTDNMSILGLTLDYGPFQFMDAYDPGHICNHTDAHGRYAFARQPRVAHWNLHALGQALMAVVNDSDAILAMLDPYPARFQSHWLHLMRAKLGCRTEPSTDGDLIHDLLEWMHADRVDHTIFWRRLSHAVTRWQAGAPVESAFEPVSDLALDRPRLGSWLSRLRDRLQTEPGAGERMLACNPKYVLRNHLGELAIKSAQSGDFSMVRDLLRVLQTPYDEHPAHEDWANFPPDWASHIEISCSS
jgi:uncharacterized protein YdiU (UPF0061 family)